jgi:hypothetical protein
MANSDVLRCIARAAEGSRNKIHGRWCRWVDDDDALEAVHLLGDVVIVILPFLHLAGAWK